MNKKESSENNFQKIFNQIRRKSRIKQCFCNNSKCSGHIIKAHSIQNNRILSQLAENGYIIQLKPSKIEGKLLFNGQNIGKKIATISTNFCQFHDTEIFKPIEIRDYKKHDKQQEFLFAYRAFAREYHVKLESKLVYEYIIEEYGPNPDLLDFLKGTNKSVKEIEKQREKFNTALNESDFDLIKTYIIEFHGFHGIAAASCFAIEYDLHGNKINDLSNFEKEFKFTFLTIFPQGKKPIFLLALTVKIPKYSHL